MPRSAANPEKADCMAVLPGLLEPRIEKFCIKLFNKISFDNFFKVSLMPPAETRYLGLIIIIIITGGNHLLFVN